MLDTRREKVLAVVFGGAIAAFGLWETFGQMVLQPFTDLRVQLDAARSNRDNLQDQSATVEHALRNMKQVAAQSLPADPGKATVLYQGWLIRHLELNSIASAIVTPAPAMVEKSIGHRIPFTVQCSASTANIARFLDEFYATPLLHRITNLNITNSSNGESDHRITLSIEALAFDSASAIEVLPEPTVFAKESSLAAVFAGDDIFRRKRSTPPQVAKAPEESNPKPVIPVKKPEPPKPDPHKSVRFVASVWNGQQREAWFVDQRSKEEQTLIASSDLSFPDIDGKVLSIDNDTMQLELAGKRCTINLGQTLSEVTFAR